MWWRIISEIFSGVSGSIQREKKREEEIKEDVGCERDSESSEMKSKRASFLPDRKQQIFVFGQIVTDLNCFSSWCSHTVLKIKK